MNSRWREIRTLSDFLDVPEEELHRCLRAFRQAVQQAKADRTNAVREGKPAKAIKFDTFTWKPQDHEIKDVGNLQGTTPIGGPIIGFIGEHLSPRFALLTSGAAAIAAAVYGAMALRVHHEQLQSQASNAGATPAAAAATAASSG